MPRALTRIGLLIGVGLLAAVTATAPAAAAPGTAAVGEPGGSAFEASPAPVPPPVRDPATPTVPKLQGTTGQVPGGAVALHLDGACNIYPNGTGDLCLWYLVNFVGASVDFYYSDNNLGNNAFIRPPNPGLGAVVANNTESGVNYDSIYTAWGCTGVNYTGLCGFARPHARGNITPAFKNNVESIYWTL
jgi:hypothetical protein